MKSLLIFLLFLVSLTCCRRTQLPHPYEVGPYSPDLCSLIVRTQLAPMIEPEEVCCTLRNEVRKRLCNDTSLHTQAVMIYLGMYERDSTVPPLSRRAMLDSAMSIVDSVNYPVMMHRIRAEILKLEAPFTKTLYYDIKRELDYFSSIKDTLSEALLEVSLGPDFSSVGCMEEALEVTQKVIRTFEDIRQPWFAARSRINEPIYYEALGDTARSDSVMRLLLADNEIRDNSPQFREGVVRNAYIRTGDTTYLNEGWTIVRSNPRFIQHTTAYYALLGEREYNQGNPDAALRLVARGREIGTRFGYPNEGHKLLLLSILAKSYDKEGMTDSALKYYKEIVIQEDSIEQLASGQEILRISYGRQMESIKYEQALQRSHDRWIWSIVAGGVIFVILGIMLCIWRQRQRARLFLLQEQGETERARHKLAANMLAKQEKDSLLTEMNRHIGRMTIEGQLNSVAASELQNMIKLHETGKKEWEALEELLVKIRPRFMARLHEIAPEMSVKYCRLAAYIYIGLSSQQIASLLMISPKSVYQGRWRLRRQLSVPEGEGLEEFLEALNSE